MKPIKRWMLFDPDENPCGWAGKTRSKTIDQKLWEEPFASSRVTWEDAKKQGWTVRKVAITEWQ